MLTKFDNFIFQAVREMAKRMPSTKEEMLKIQHVTRANYDKFGPELLEITKESSDKRIGI